MRLSRKLLISIVLAGLNSLTAYAEQLPLTTLNAQFETTECKLPCNKTAKATKTIWWMWRSPSQVELRKAESTSSELWTIESNNQLYYQFLMHDEKRVIEYSPIDLKLLNSDLTAMQTDTAKWQALTSLVTQKDLAGMKKTSLKKQYQGLNLTAYQGKINGIKTHITWIEALQIPLQLTYVYPKHQVSIQLLKQDSNVVSALATSEQTLQSYQRTDYADIGDMEHSPAAKVWLSKAHDAPGISKLAHQH